MRIENKIENTINIENAIVMLDSNFLKYPKSKISELVRLLKSRNQEYSFYPLANKEHIKTFFEKVLMFPNIEIHLLVGGEYFSDFTDSDIETLLERAKKYLGYAFNGNIIGYSDKIEEVIKESKLEQKLEKIFEEDEKLDKEFERLSHA